MKCKIEGCDGQVDTTSNGVSLKVGCAASSTAYPCSKCKRLYWADGDLVFSRAGHAAFLDHSSGKPVALINPFVKGQEGKGFTYYVIYNPSIGMYLSSSGKFTCKTPGRSRLFESAGAASVEAMLINLCVEVSSETVT